MRKKIKETFKQSVFALLISQIIVKSLGLVYKLYLTNREGFGDEGNAISTASFQVYALILSVTSKCYFKISCWKKCKWRP